MVKTDNHDPLQTQPDAAGQSPPSSPPIPCLALILKQLANGLPEGHTVHVRSLSSCGPRSAFLMFEIRLMTPQDRRARADKALRHEEYMAWLKARALADHQYPLPVNPPDAHKWTGPGVEITYEDPRRLLALEEYEIAHPAVFNGVGVQQLATGLKQMIDLLLTDIEVDESSRPTVSQLPLSTLSLDPPSSEFTQPTFAPLQTHIPLGLCEVDENAYYYTESGAALEDGYPIALPTLQFSHLWIAASKPSAIAATPRSFSDGTLRPPVPRASALIQIRPVSAEPASLDWPNHLHQDWWFNCLLAPDINATDEWDHVDYVFCSKSKFAVFGSEVGEWTDLALSERSDVSLCDLARQRWEEERNERAEELGI